jgi:hypothetical protein
MAGRRASGAVVAAVVHPRAELLDAGRVGVIDDGRRLGDRVGIRREHTRPATQDLLDDVLLRGVMQPADMQNRGTGHCHAHSIVV